MKTPSSSRFAMAVWCLLLSLTAQTLAQEIANGWRGNATGIWADAQPPLTWGRRPLGIADSLRSQSQRPAAGDEAKAAIVEKGLLRDWLVIGPFEVPDSERDFDVAVLKDESSAQPNEGETINEKTWKPTQSPADDPMVFGTAELPWLDLNKVFSVAKKQIGYAHTYVYSPASGKVRAVVDHSYGLKVWLNGREIYRQPKREMHLGSYQALSRYELNHLPEPSPEFELDLQAGWNRLLFKLSSFNFDSNEMRFCLRLMDRADVVYESQNIRWMTELPGRSTSTPILVGDRIFVFAEPDELVCLDKFSGRILWTRFINYVAALSPAERTALPAVAERLDPLVTRLAKETNRRERATLRATIQKTQSEIDPGKFNFAADGHFEAHFGIVGFTMPTPVSDGRHVYVWSGMGIAACFDLNGQQQWMTRVPTDHLSYGSSPALADGILAVFLNKVYGLDARTGEVKWEQPRVQRNVASLLAARLGGQPVFITQRGEALRPRDGKLLFRPQGATSAGDMGWAPPVILGETMYLARYGVTEMHVFDFTDVSGDTWQPKEIATLHSPPEVSRKPDGGWIDRWTAGSALIWDGLIYETDIYQTLYAYELSSRKMVVRQDLPLHGLTHYNAVAVAASPTLIGKHIFVCDNQGTTLVVEPGPAAKIIAKNCIQTVLERKLPIPAQETLAYAPPIADGNRLYLRGERFLYCIAQPPPQ